MVAGRIMAVIGLGTLVVAGSTVMPAVGAPDVASHRARPVAAAFRGLGSFTPASADPRLAAVFARAGLDTAEFRFTPTDQRSTGRAVTVAVRARSSRSAFAAERAASLASESISTVSIAPIAYNLGVAVGWRRFALSGDVSHVDLAGVPGSREGVDLGVTYAGHRFSGRVKAAADRPLATGVVGPLLITEVPSYSVDVAGSYALTHNLDVTAGVRYKAERDRLQAVPDDRRDSQAVYIGTAFRF